MNQQVLITLPEDIYDRVKVTADALSLSLETVLTESLVLFFPALERNMPPENRVNVAALSLLSDAQLWPVAHQHMQDDGQARLEELAQLRKHRELDPEEQASFEDLMHEAQQIMLSKAEAYRILAQRGHTMFTQSTAQQTQ